MPRSAIPVGEGLSVVARRHQELDKAIAAAHDCANNQMIAEFERRGWCTAAMKAGCAVMASYFDGPVDETHLNGPAPIKVAQDVFRDVTRTWLPDASLPGMDTEWYHAPTVEPKPQKPTTAEIAARSAQLMAGIDRLPPEAVTPKPRKAPAPAPSTHQRPPKKVTAPQGIAAVAAGRRHTSYSS